jgi:hypothetical protein
MAVAALIISIVAILFAGWAAWSASRALRHDQAQTGTRQPVIARKGHRHIRFDAYDPDPTPAGWPKEQLRWVPVLLINRSTYPITLEGPTYASLGWRWPLRWEVQVARSEQDRVVPPNKALWYFVRMRKPKWWKRPKRRFLTVRWAADGGPVKFKGWVKLWDGLPSAPSPEADS